MKNLHMVTFILLIVGGLNWLLVGLFNWGIGNLLGSGLSRLVYVLVGISAIVEIVNHKKTCKLCDKGMAMPGGAM